MTRHPMPPRGTRASPRWSAISGRRSDSCVTREPTSSRASRTAPDKRRCAKRSSSPTTTPITWDSSYCSDACSAPGSPSSVQPSVTPPDAGPGRIRTLERGDIPPLVALSQQAFQRRERIGADAMTAYFERIFFHNPWVDADLPSLVYEDETGRVGGFVGVVPRRMLFRDEPIRVAVTTQLMVAPRYGGQVGRRLMTRLLAGPQELSITDDANDAARRLWESLGGECSPIYGLRWARCTTTGRSSGCLPSSRRRPSAARSGRCSFAGRRDRSRAGLCIA